MLTSSTVRRRLAPKLPTQRSVIPISIDCLHHAMLSGCFVTLLVFAHCYRSHYNPFCLAVIIGSIVSLVYPVKSSKRGSRRAVLSHLEARLDQWYLELPDDLRYDPASKRNTPPAPVLYLHVKYWAAVLLLHRAL